MKRGSNGVSIKLNDTNELHFSISSLVKEDNGTRLIMKSSLVLGFKDVSV